MTTEMHKAPSVAHNTGTSGDNATSVARYDLSTSEGGRRYVADFFARDLRRHDFARYITTTLAADFACALAQHLAATGKQQVGELPEDVVERCRTLPTEKLLNCALEVYARSFKYGTKGQHDAAMAYKDEIIRRIDGASAQVAEVQGDARAQFEAWAVSIGARIDTDEHGNYLSSALNYSKLGWDAALAARQPGGELHLPPDGFYKIVFDDAEVPDESFARSGALDAALRRFEQISNKWNAHLFVRFANNTRDCTVPNATPAQGIDLGKVREIRIPARNKLDPISVFVQDQAAGRGRIVVTCYGNAWQAFWGAMGNRTVMQFVAQCDADYVAGNMISGRQTRMTKAERAYTERIAAEVIAEFRALLDGQRNAAPGVGHG
ncbi:hypothetical protein KX924_14005 [Streptomyces sp. II-2-2-2]